MAEPTGLFHLYIYVGKPTMRAALVLQPEEGMPIKNSQKTVMASSPEWKVRGRKNTSRIQLRALTLADAGPERAL